MSELPRESGRWISLLSGMIVAAFLGFLILAALPHARSVVTMGDDVYRVYRFQKRITSSEFRDSCKGWMEQGLAGCIIREVRERRLLDEPTSSRRLLLHGVILRALGKAYGGLWDSRYRSYSDAVFILIHDFEAEERRTGKLIALSSPDPDATDVFHPARVDEAEVRAMKSLNGRLWRTYQERTQRMKAQGVSENLGSAQWKNLQRSYDLIRMWESRIQWEKP